MNYKKLTAKKYEVKYDLVRVYGCRCYYCDNYFPITKLTLDHIYPLSKQQKRKTTVSTCVLACFPCNRRKWDRVISIEDFRKEVMGDKYYPMDDKYFVAKPVVQKVRKHRKFDQYAHDIKYPENPIVKHNMTLKELLRKIFIHEK